MFAATTVSAEFPQIQQIQAIRYLLATATRDTRAHYVPRKYVIIVVPQMVELAILGQACAKAVQLIVLDQKLVNICTVEEMPATDLATSVITMVHVVMLQGNAHALLTEKSMQTVVKTSRTQHAPQVLAVLENASTRHIVSAMLGLLESIAIPGFVQRIAIGMNSNHKANVFTTKKVQ